jgi:hypothetical protein
MNLRTSTLKRTAIPVAIIIALILACCGYFIFKPGREQQPIDKREWINSRFAEIHEGMTVEQVHQVLGQAGSFRVKREENDLTRFALYGVSHHGMLYTEYWDWDDGQIAVAFSKEKPRRVVDKGICIYGPGE